MRQDADPYAPSPVARASAARASLMSDLDGAYGRATDLMGRGLVWFAIGALVTGITYWFAPMLRGGYVVFWGAMLYGAVQIVRGGLLYMRVRAVQGQITRPR